MNYGNIQTKLGDYNEVQVGIYINYLKEVEAAKNAQQQLKNAWFKYVTEDQAADLYKKVALDEGLFIDGDTITLSFRGKVLVNYNYQAYKNKLLTVYPESLFDIQNVYAGDEFAFEKQNGHVVYTHKIKDPFAVEREIVGCYCIIKNSRGEFIETLNKPEITKMRAVAKTKAIWDAWYSEMVLKSVIKRACKRHFKDVVVNIELIDNENYEPEIVEIEPELSGDIEQCKTMADLEDLYHENKGTVKDEVAFIKLINERKAELLKDGDNGNS